VLGSFPENLNAQGQYQGQLPRPRPRTDSPRSRTDSPRPRPRTGSPRQDQGLGTQGQGLIVQGQGLAVQGEDQGLESQDQGHGQLASRILETKTVSSWTPSLMCIKSVLRTVHCVYSTVLYTTTSLIKNYDWRIAHAWKSVNLDSYTMHMVFFKTAKHTVPTMVQYHARYSSIPHSFKSSQKQFRQLFS